ncbi:12518_t:CDS:2, partial [Racocetra persica]
SLRDENQCLSHNLEIVRRLDRNMIANQNVQIRNLEDRVEIYSAVLSERGMCTIPMLRKHDAFIILEGDEQMDTDEHGGF